MRSGLLRPLVDAFYTSEPELCSGALVVQYVEHSVGQSSIICEPFYKVEDGLEDSAFVHLPREGAGDLVVVLLCYYLATANKRFVQAHERCWTLCNHNSMFKLTTRTVQDQLEQLSDMVDGQWI
jgi:hypothetical protein